MANGSSSVEEKPGPAWARWLVPSVGDGIFVVLLGLLCFTKLSVRLLGDAGIGWHIRTGQLILADHAIPRVDPFSSTMGGHAWFAWEWLYDLMAGWLDQAAGLNGVVLLAGLIIALTFSWTFLLLVRRGTNFMVALILLLLAASASMIHFLARPHVVSWWFTVICFSLLERSEVEGSVGHSRLKGWRLFVGLPLLMVVWASLHAGFLVGFVLLAIYWSAAVVEYRRLREDRWADALRKLRAGNRARYLMLVSLASALATLINPYGWGLQVHIYRYLSNQFLMNHIDEFQSPNFHRVAQKCFAVLLMLSFVAMAARKSNPQSLRTSQILIVLFAFYSGLFASRNLPVSSLLLVLVIGPRLSRAVLPFPNPAWRRRSPVSASEVTTAPFLVRMQAVEVSRCGHLWPVTAAFLTIWIAFHGGMVGSKPWMNAQFDARRFPAAALDYMQKQHLPGPVLVPDNWGGYLIYRLYPKWKVAVDDRHDLYGENFLKGYLALMHVEPNWSRFLKQTEVGCIVVPKDSPVANILAESTSWQIVYGDDVAEVYAKNSAPGR